MKKVNNACVGICMFAWVVIAQAQAILVPQFGDQITEIGWQAWALVFGYGAVGTIMRLNKAIKEQEINPTPLELAAWGLLGIFSAFATFAFCEAINGASATRVIPDLMEGILISTGAYNHKRVINWLTGKLEKVFGAEKSEGA